MTNEVGYITDIPWLLGGYRLKPHSLPWAAPSGSGWCSTINPCNHGITIHKSQSKVHFTLRFTVYNNGLAGGKVRRLEYFLNSHVVVVF